MDKNTYHLIGHKLCPYVQRVVILMQEKQIPFVRTDIDLYDKPAWLESLSPTGKVPILVVNEDKAIFESSVICEYLDEISLDSLHPDDILERAIHRSWIAFGTEILDCIANIIYRDKTYRSVETTMEEIAERFCVVEQVLSGGEYFSSSQFHIIDAVYATIFRYFDVICPLTTVDPFLKLIKVKRWREVLRQRETVKNAVPKNYNDLLVEFIKGKDSYVGEHV